MENFEINKKLRMQGTVLVLISAIFFSLGGILIKKIPWSPEAINAIRSIPAFIVIYLYMKWLGHKVKFNRTVLLGAVCNFLMSLTFVMATKYTTAGNAIALQFTEPMFLILILWLVFKKKPNKLAVFTCFAAIVGIACFFMDELSAKSLPGNFLAILSGLTYAVVFMLKTLKNSDFESSLLISFVFATIVGFPAYMGETEHSLNIYLLVLALGVLQFAVAFIFLSKGLDYVSPVTASLTSTIEPILNPILVAIFYGEMLGKFSILGAAIVIGAALNYNLREMKQ
ncbi:MAG: DMT family transporter [Eubacteriales bacterium]